METGTNIIKGGQIIRKSHNLRAMRDYARHDRGGLKPCA